MRITFYSAKEYDQLSFSNAEEAVNYDLQFVEQALDLSTVEHSKGSVAICVFVNDTVSEEVLVQLRDYGVKFVLLRCAGFNNIDLAAAKKWGIQVANVPAYSPESIAEHAVALLLSLNRRIPTALNRVKQFDFSLDGLQGIVLKGKKVGIVGTGKIGIATASILKGFGMELIAYDPYPNKAFEELGGRYVTFDYLVKQSDVISLSCPATPENIHLFNDEVFQKTKPGVLLINTGRGVLIDTSAAIKALQSGILRGLGLDVYEKEAALFFNNHRNETIQDDELRLLLSFENVILTGHQAFLTEEALGVIADITFRNLKSLNEEGSEAFIVH